MQSRLRNIFHAEMYIVETSMLNTLYCVNIGITLGLQRRGSLNQFDSHGSNSDISR